MLGWDKTPVLAPMRCSRAWVEIDLDALVHNVQVIKSLLSPGADLMSVVKADAYGHGAVTVARTVLNAGATWLGVATVPEGIELRQSGITAPILVMGAVNDPVEVLAIAHWQLQPTIVNPKQALVFSDTLAAHQAQFSATEDDYRDLPIHLKLDTGMSRLGFPWSQSVAFARFVNQLPHLETVSVYSHFATADSPDRSTMQLQKERFEQAISDLKQADLLPLRIHLANSAATLVDASLHYDMVRVGLATYGLYPAPHFRHNADLKAALSVKARITHLKEIAPGDGISYGHRFVAKDTMRIAVVGIGYADGVPRLLSNRLQVAIAGQPVPQLGAITMDQMMLDVSTLPTVQEGDVVTLLGQSGEHCFSADQWADMAGTISWEILCGFKHRLPRILRSNALPVSLSDQSALSESSPLDT